MVEARARIIIRGRVQGVFFRYSTKDKADSIGVFGWVRNLRDGSVEAVVEGEKNKVEDLVAWCHHGPPHARVTQVEVSWEEPVGEFDEFKVTWTR